MLLADPSNYGNVPGEGPLRRGGVSVGEPKRESDLPSTMSKAASAQAPALAICRDLWEGNEAVKGKATVYLPQNPGEESPDYNDRLERSVFENFFGRTIEGLTGLVFKQDPVLGDDVPKPIVEHWENIDNAGTHGAVFARDLLQDALTAGHVCILVDYPKTGGTQTARDEDPEKTQFPVRPYWVPVYKDNILSWRTANVNGHTILTQVVIKECTMVPDGEFGEKEQTRYRVLYRDDAGVVGFRLLEVTEKKAVIEVDAGTYPTQTEIPLAECVTSGRKSILQSRPPCVDIAYLNIAHYQQSSDYFRTLHMVVPFLFFAGGDEVGENGATTVVGPNSAVRASNSQATAQYVSHSGTGISDQRQALEDIKSDIGALGLSMLAPKAQVQETATAHRIGKATQESALSVSARGLQDGLERAKGFHAKYLGLPSGGSVTVNRDFEGLLMQADVMSAFGALVAAGFPPRVVLKEFQKGGRIPEDENLEELEAEWLGAIAAAEAQKQAEAELRAQQMEDEQVPDEEKAA